MTVDLKLGRKPYVEDHRDLLAHNYTAQLPQPPTEFDIVPNVNKWPVFLNDVLGDCVTPDTLILTEALEWVRAGSLQVGDKLLGFDEDSQTHGVTGRLRGRWFQKSIVEKAEIVTRPCYELEFDDGTIVRSSSGHQWLTGSTVQGYLKCQVWSRTEDLTVGPSKQTRVVKPLDVWQEDTSWDAGYLAAAVDGEGHLEQKNRSNRVCFSQTANPMFDQAELSFKELGFAVHHSVNDRHKLLRVDGSHRKELHVLRIGSRREFLRFMGSVRPRRLLNAYDVASLGRIPGESVALIRKTFIGEQPVVMLDTSSRTYFANGLASHNCTIAAIAHMVQVWVEAVTGKTPTIRNTIVEQFYEQVSGYVPGDESTDNGANMRDVLKRWLKQEFDKHAIKAFARVNNFADLRSALWGFGGLYLGLNLPLTARDQLEKGEAWDIVDGQGDQVGSWGGHAVNAISFDAKGFTVVTWGKRQYLSNDFLQEYGDEAYAVLSVHDWLSKGKSPDGFDLTQLDADLTALRT